MQTKSVERLKSHTNTDSETKFYDFVIEKQTSTWEARDKAHKMGISTIQPSYGPSLTLILC